MNFFNKKFKNFFFKRIIYGYKKLKVQNNIKLFSNINDELTVKQLNLYNKKNLFFGENYIIAEKSIRQKLIREVAGFRLIQFILFFHSYNLKLCYPLCNEWIEVLTNNNIKVVLSVGDESGVGPEIILKALCSDELPLNIDITLVGSKKHLLNTYITQED